MYVYIYIYIFIYMYIHMYIHKHLNPWHVSLKALKTVTGWGQYPSHTYHSDYPLAPAGTYALFHSGQALALYCGPFMIQCRQNTAPRALSGLSDLNAKALRGIDRTNCGELGREQG